MNYVGRRVPRREDDRLIRGEGRYAGDLHPPGMLHVGFVRSPHAHAGIGTIDTRDALRVPGVHAIHTAANFPLLSRPVEVAPYPTGLEGRAFSPLATGTVRFVGEPVAMVIADSEPALADAIDLVWVEYEPLPAVSGIEAALAGEALVWPEIAGNVALKYETGFGDIDGAFKLADVVVEGDFSFARSAPVSLEPRAVLAVPDDGEYRLTLWDSTQAPHNVRGAVAAYLDLPVERVRVVTPDVGGGFGPKGRIYAEEYALAAASLRHGVPLRWLATRSEDMLTTAHGRAQRHHASLAARADGTILGLRDDFQQDAGAYTAGGMAAPMNTINHLVGPYRLPALRINLTGVYTNALMTSPLRGGGRPEGVFVVERLLDALARATGIDRVELRRRNFLAPEEFPYDTGLTQARGGPVRYDSGDFPRYVEMLCAAVEYDSWRQRQLAARVEGRYLGLGIAAFIESTGVGREEARMCLEDDGSVSVQVGSPSNGQGHATTFAQMAATRLGVPLHAVNVTSGDTGAVDVGTGTFASRMGQSGGNAVSIAARELRDRLVETAGNMLEIAPADLELVDGLVRVRGLPERSLTLSEVASEARRQGIDLATTGSFESSGPAWAGGMNAALVEVDPNTGLVHVLRYTVIHDAGVLVNPTVVEGQIHGGVVHGIGNALYERFVYDGNGTPITGSLLDYTLPGIGEAPPITIEHIETPSPFNREGIKGAGEGGTIGAIPTIASAVEDALSPFGITINHVPIEPEWLLEEIARRTQAGEA